MDLEQRIVVARIAWGREMAARRAEIDQQRFPSYELRVRRLASWSEAFERQYLEPVAAELIQASGVPDCRDNLAIAVDVIKRDLSLGQMITMLQNQATDGAYHGDPQWGHPLARGTWKRAK